MRKDAKWYEWTDDIRWRRASATIVIRKAWGFLIRSSSVWVRGVCHCILLYLYHRFLFLISGKKEYVDVRSRFLFWRERNANRRSDRRRRPSLLSRTARPRAAE